MEEQEKFLSRLKGVGHEVARKTQDAYSYDAYGWNNWLAIAYYLEDVHGLNARQLENFLRSKHTRWARDASSADYSYGEYPLDVIVEYAEKYPSSVEPSELDY